ncbi:toll-like receptor 6 [Babylonia areolata]|uniref:toll-like receptor 6 n=1 Tax=Babylonia areolata TaxID=304850 RepID=UPI003FD47B4B
MFKHCPNLESLRIINTNMELSPREMRQLLSPLTSLTDLCLKRIGKSFFPEDLLWRLPKLQSLDLSANGLGSAVVGRALRNVSSIRSLKLSGNDITVVNESILPWPLRRQLNSLDLSHNPFSCTCDLRWFQRWLDDVSLNKSVKVYGYDRKRYICGTPPRRHRVRINDVRFTDEECGEQRSLALAVGVAGGCVLALVLFTAGMTYRYRWFLRFYLYRYRRRRQDAQEAQPLNHHHEFDVYLAYSSADLQWVCEELLPLLEGEHGLRAFLHDRDTVPGTVMAENITRCMDNSTRILLLISDRYVREQWRLFEFEHIVYASIDQQKDVIVVLLGDVEAGRMTKEMTRMLTRGTFLQWGNSEEARKVFREGLEVALKTEDHSCQSVC